jgi:hypothetical protein
LFYANTVKALHREDSLVFAFGQLASAGNVHAEVLIETPRIGLRLITETFTEFFREKVSAVGKTPFPPFPDGIVGNSLAYQAPFCRLLVNDFLGLFDFYELSPALGKFGDVKPLVRVKALPSIMRFFVDEFDAHKPPPLGEGGLDVTFVRKP